jgi:hypothetical protein
MGVENIYKYNTYKIIDQDEEALAKNENPFAIVILTVLLALKKGKQPEEEVLSFKIELARALLRKAIPKDKVRSIMNFLRYYIRLEKPENVRKFEHEINTITNRNALAMGIEEFLLQRAEKQGIKKGLEEAKTIFVKSLLESTDFDDAKIASIADVTVSFVKEIRSAMQ